MHNYKNKLVYVGIDVHKKSYSTTAVCGNKVIKKDTMPGDPKVLTKYLKNHFKGAKIHDDYLELKNGNITL